MSKINILYLGSCTSSDIMASDPLYHNNFKTYGVYFGSISRSFEKPGPLAARLEEETQNKTITNRSALDQINMIIKRKTPVTLLENLPPNTVVILDYAYELLNFFNNGLEMFDIHANYENIKTHLPNWLRKEIFTNYKHFDSNTMEMAYKQYHCMHNFYKTIKSKNIPIVAMTNTFSPKVYDKVSNSVGEIFPFFNKKMPFLNINSMSDEMMKYKYSRKIIDKFYQQILDHLDADDFFHIPLNDVYADPDHPWGYHPTHYHRTCRVLLSQQLQQKVLERYYTTNKTKIIT